MLSIIIIVGIIFSAPIFKYADENSNELKKRNLPMDGVRTFLASFVALFHSEYIINYIYNGKWENSREVFLYLAQLGVSIFFIITAYLFWGKVRKTGDINWIDLYKDRVFRIAPATYVTAIISIVMLLYFTNYPDSNNLSIKNVLRWFDMGMMYNYPPINASSDSWLLLGVFWTLQWEWGFYLSLPLLSLMKKNSLAFVLSLLFSFIYIIPLFNIIQPTTIGICLLFIGGMLCRELKELIKLNKPTLNVILLASIILIFALKPAVYTIYMLPFYSSIIFCISKGADLFGLLTIKGLVRLGNCSFSIYVMHTPLMYFIYKILKNKDIISSSESFGYFSLLAIYFIICLFASFNWRLIEKPFVIIGKKIKL